MGLHSCVSVVVAVLGLLLLCHCEATPPPPAPGCEPSCQTREPSCLACPAIVEEICLDGLCEARGIDTVDLAIDVSLGRDLVGVSAVAIAIVDARVSACANVGPVVDALNVVAGNRINVTGGTFHEDLRVGLVPEGDLIIAVDALGPGDQVVASGCEEINNGDVNVLVNVPAASF